MWIGCVVLFTGWFHRCIRLASECSSLMHQWNQPVNKTTHPFITLSASVFHRASWKHLLLLQLRQTEWQTNSTDCIISALAEVYAFKLTKRFPQIWGHSCESCEWCIKLSVPGAGPGFTQWGPNQMWSEASYEARMSRYRMRREATRRSRRNREKASRVGGCVPLPSRLERLRERRCFMYFELERTHVVTKSYYFWDFLTHKIALLWKVKPDQWKGGSRVRTPCIPSGSAPAKTYN